MLTNPVVVTKGPLKRIYPPILKKEKTTLDFLFGYGPKNTKTDVLKHQTSFEI